ncbi:1-(5-phosphoribosyl)-5-[(5-phosphoribosylamino)methylideneamino]imidazole-4-carboxamide isomerase [Alphaproteobacteria bacterium]|nr:1-(5-phosphoribosyl)-5-[(5-phosphoribosylamino)methylideneamino]imidazole-4-carboxamide isomerase [Alphaproteobacteria bacterium]MDC0148642.1 1-(5-phosphoribosyl)-5-[(5-phosphoribosylamino)methylideneamino]imidazole-4-carboxamide isomerase [Alphaproteobacteria bacterium]
MILYPAIDLKDGQCVRLEQGDMRRATVFNADPTAQAADFEAQGFSHLHIIDLNGAFAGAPVHKAAVEAILAQCKLTIQLGGGIRDMATIESWLGAGVDRVILGTAALRNPQLVYEACKAFPGRIAVGVDARKGFVAVEGWAEETQIQADDLTRQFEDAGVAAVIYTDIDRDGLLKGVNIEATAALARGTSIPIIASGGLADLNDLVGLQEVESDGVVGAISGRALYDGRLDAAQALAMDGVI